MPSIKDIAEVAGVSVTTVSFVLNNKGNIAPETRERVLKIVKEMDYTRSIHARNLRDNLSRVIGYAQNPRRHQVHALFDSFLYEVVKLVEARGRHILLFHPDMEQPTRVYQNLIDSRRVDAFILSYTQQGDERVRFLHEDVEIPFAAFGRSRSPLDDVTSWVDVDGEAGLDDVTRHLVEHGHRRIGIIAWPEGSASGDARFLGYLNALRDYGIGYDEGLVTRAINSIANGCTCAQHLLDQPDAPTAIMAMTDTLTFGALRCIGELDRPIAITGFDDSPMAEFLSLTSVRQPIREVAELLVDMVIAQVNGKAVVVQQHLLKPELVVRSSSIVPTSSP